MNTATLIARPGSQGNTHALSHTTTRTATSTNTGMNNMINTRTVSTIGTTSSVATKTSSASVSGGKNAAGSGAMPSIFHSTSQCLHVCYLMEVLPATQRSFLQAMLEAHMKACGIWEQAKPADHAINFTGMNALEVRGQCAMVRGIVEHHLPAPEAHSVKAHYGHGKTKADGVRGLTEYLGPLLSTTHPEAALALAWGAFGTPRQRQGLSLREVSEHYGLSRSSAQRDQKTITRMGRDMLIRAIDRLDQRFQASGLVERVG